MAIGAEKTSRVLGQKWHKPRPCRSMRIGSVLPFTFDRDHALSLLDQPPVMSRLNSICRLPHTLPTVILDGMFASHWTSILPPC
jgi:hypothetical protein